MRAWMGLAMVVVLAGCKDRSDDRAQPATSSPELVEAGEGKRLEKELMAQIETNRSRHCRRPVLRGEARPGPADEDVLAFLDFEGELASCFAAVEAAGAIEELIHDEEGSRQLQDTEDDAKLLAIRAACNELPVAVGRVIAHENACSPFLPGRHGQVDFVGLLRGSWAAVVLARELEREGHRLAAAELLLDVVRLGEDIGRGGTSVLEPVLGGVAQRTALVELRRLIARPGVGDNELAAIARQLKLLWETRVPLRDTLLAIDDELELHVLMPSLRGPDWEPPGGMHRLSPGTDAPSLMAADSALGEDGLVLTWIALENVERAWDRACPASASLETCMAGVRDSVVASAADAPQNAEGVVQEALSSHAASGDHGVRAVVRDRLVSGLEAIAADSHGKHFHRLAWADADLESVELLARSLLASRRGEPCPASLRDDGVGLVVREKADGLEVSAPSWLHDDVRYHRVLAVLVCRAA